MLTYSFEHAGSDSLYEYLYKCIKNDILSGTLPPDYKLPSKRTFAKNLGVSTITIENAYGQLVAEGYLYSLPKKGFYVSDIPTIQPSAPLSSSIFSGKNSANSSSFDIIHPTVISPLISEHETSEFQYTADLTSNRTKTANFPFFTWSKIMKEIVTEQSQELMTPSPAAGILPLRKAIASHLYDFRGMQISPDQIIIGAGTEYLYSLLIQLLGHDKTFAVEDPGYGKIRMIYESNQVQVESVPLDDDGIHMKSLERTQADILHISPSHHYPTGIITPISRRYELLGWALKHENRYIIEDDYDCEFRFSGRPIPSLQSIDVSDKVIYMNTFTKSLSPTIRISYMVLPQSLMKEFNSRLGFYSCTVSNFEQYTLARFIEEGHFEKHINRMRIFYRKQRDMLIHAIQKSPLSDYVQIQEKDAGLHFLMKVQTSATDHELIDRARKQGLKIACLSQYYHNPAFAVMHTLVINYSSIDEEGMDEAIHSLLAVVKSSS